MNKRACLPSLKVLKNKMGEGEGERLLQIAERLTAESTRVVPS